MPIAVSGSYATTTRSMMCLYPSSCAMSLMHNIGVSLCARASSHFAKMLDVFSQKVARLSLWPMITCVHPISASICASISPVSALDPVGSAQFCAPTEKYWDNSFMKRLGGQTTMFLCTVLM